MQRANRVVTLAVAVLAVGICATRRAEAQSGQLRASVSRVVDGTDLTPARFLSAGGLASAAFNLAAEEPSVLSQAIAELFQVPRSLSHLSFAVDNALASLDQYRSFEFVAPRLYYAARTYRVTASIEF
jgi:hypothetical protein